MCGEKAGIAGESDGLWWLISKHETEGLHYENREPSALHHAANVVLPFLVIPVQVIHVSKRVVVEACGDGRVPVLQRGVLLSRHPVRYEP